MLAQCGIFVIIALLSLVVAIPGGLSPIPNPNSDEQVLAVAHWAVEQLYSNVVANIKVNSASKQVVAGLKYVLDVQVERPDAPCVRLNLDVWDRFGTMRLMDNSVNAQGCV